MALARLKSLWDLDPPSPSAPRVLPLILPRGPPRTPLQRIAREIPLLFIGVLLLWAYHTYTVGICVDYYMRKRGDSAAALYYMAIFHVVWGGAVASLLATVAYGPGRVEKGRSGDQEARWGELEQLPVAHEEVDEAEEDMDSNVPLLSRSATGRGQADARQASADGDADDDLVVYRCNQPDQVGRVDRSRSHLESSKTSSSISSLSTPMQAKSNGGRRFCRKCNLPKPDRAHHCSSCGFCCLRMDHHCPWLGARCIGWRNHKSFILFLLYMTLTCAVSAYVAGVALTTYVEEAGPADSPLSWGFLLLIGVLFGMVIGSFAGFHVYLAANNRTTLESMESRATSRIRLFTSATDAPPPVTFQQIVHSANSATPTKLQARSEVLPSQARTRSQPSQKEDSAAFMAALDGDISRPENESSDEDDLALGRRQLASRAKAAKRLGAGSDEISLRDFMSALGPRVAVASSAGARPLPPLPLVETATVEVGGRFEQERDVEDGGRRSEGRAGWRSDDYLTRSELRELEGLSKRRNIYDLGYLRNLKAIFGTQYYLWPIPTHPPRGTGYTFEINRSNLAKLQEVTASIRLSAPDPRAAW